MKVGRDVEDGIGVDAHAVGHDSCLVGLRVVDCESFAVGGNPKRAVAVDADVDYRIAECVSADGICPAVDCRRVAGESQRVVGGNPQAAVGRVGHAVDISSREIRV